MTRYGWLAVVLVSCGGSSTSSDAPACTGFCREALPAGVEVLHAVWGTSAKDVWAVGRDGVIVHSDGARWSSSASPVKVALRSVWGTSSSDVWAAGGDTAGVIVHYDGKAWALATAPATKLLTSVFASAPNDAWAVSEIGEILHFDGAGWSLAASTAPVAWGLHGTSANNVWIAGSEGRTWRGGTGGFAEVPTPIKDDSITQVFALSATEAVAVGFHEVYMRFTGGAWTVVRDSTDGGAFVWSVFATAANDVWMVGSGGYLQRHDGTKFEYFDIERVGFRTFDKHLYGVWATPRDVFAVGDTAIFHLRR